MSGEGTIEFRTAAVAEAMKVWTVGASEKKKGSTKAIAEDSGMDHSIFKKDGTIYEWCGMFAAAMLYRAGFCRELRGGLYHTKNAVRFFTYEYDDDRVPRWVWDEALAAWRETRELHAAQGSLRRWIDRKALASCDLASLDVGVGDVALIDHKADGRADHITLVESYDPATGVLKTIEGNGYGWVAKVDPDGAVNFDREEGDAVVRVERDLKDPSARKKLFGVGRLSRVDFESRVYDKHAQRPKPRVT